MRWNLVVRSLTDDGWHHWRVSLLFKHFRSWLWQHCETATQQTVEQAVVSDCAAQSVRHAMHCWRHVLHHHSIASHYPYGLVYSSRYFVTWRSDAQAKQRTSSRITTAMQHHHCCVKSSVLVQLQQILRVVSQLTLCTQYHDRFRLRATVQCWRVIIKQQGLKYAAFAAAMSWSEVGHCGGALWLESSWSVPLAPMLSFSASHCIPLRSESVANRLLLGDVL